MQPNILQSLIHLNRNTIHNLHHTAHICKWTAKGYYKSGMDHLGDQCYEEYVKATRKIAKLVVVQRALKQELATEIDWQRANSWNRTMLFDGSHI